MNYFSKTSRWISAPQTMVSRYSGQDGAPFFRKKYPVEKSDPLPVIIRFCGIGLAELYLNGEKISAGILDPAPSVYDKHCYFREYRATLLPGMNLFAVILGNGLYNCQANDFWQFHSAPWRDYPKMIFEMRDAASSEVLLTSDSSWLVSTDTPIIFNNWHGGESYDARKDFDHWLTPEFDDSSWQHAAVKPSPGGEVIPEIAPAAEIVNSFEAVDTIAPFVYDLGRIITGNVKIAVRGEAGSKITLRYSDHLSPDGKFTQVDLGQFVPDTEVQTDNFILRGNRITEEWSPSFVYHSFQYVRISIRGNAEIISLTAREIRTGFERIGSVTTGNDTMQKLYQAVMASYSGNFVGIPTDCPHREKNGWTADAAFAAESGLTAFAAEKSYLRYLQCLADTQRQSGQLAAIAPSAGWGYNYGSGPVWDSALWLIPYYLYIHTGNPQAIKTFYDAIARHCDYTGTLAENGIVRFGLGDHCHPFPEKAVPIEFANTCFYIMETDMLARFAGLLGKEDDRQYYSDCAQKLRKELLAAHPDRRESTALALLLQLGMGSNDTLPQLIEQIEAVGGKADFGIIGAKFIPRLLAENGRSDLAFKIFTQQEFPGWGNWIARGATTLWEYWDGSFSRNHIMFGDIAAWMMRYPGGIAPSWDNPAMQELVLKPLFPEGLNDFAVKYRHASGWISLSWQKQDDKISLQVTSPAAGKLESSNRVYDLHPGENRFNIER
ncbi:MAG: hypothetical protein E7058_08850 [Lentisphaerae bacterium]|nr:hypothetical protein [Lentisphaerota bacterium]